MRQVIVNKVVKYWQEGAEQNFETAKFLFKGRRYSDCLFFCHLMIEKILKGLIVETTKEHAPYSHELDALAKKTKLPLTDKQFENLKIISTFNIAARYDNIKYAFYKKANKNYTEKYFTISKELFIWLKNQYQRK